MFKVKLSAFLGAICLLVSSLTTQAIAGSIGFGLNAEGSFVETTGSETLKSNSTVTNATKSTGAFIPSGFIQYTFGDDGFVVGYSRAPGSAEIGASETTRVDKIEVNTANTVTQIAKAEIRDLENFYVETPTFGGMYLKAALNSVDVITKENLGTGSSYGDASVDGTTYGIGWRSAGQGILLKVEANYTDWDSLSLSSTGSDVSSTITAQPEQTSLKLSFGYNF